MKTIWHKSILLIVSIFLFASFPTMAQVNDFMIWQGFSVEKGINKANGFEISESLRLNENATAPYKFLLETGWNHRFSRTLKTGIFYRYFINDPFENFQSGHRFYTDISLRKKINHWQIGWRIRMQSTYYATSGENSFDYEAVNRHKLSLQYKRKKLRVSPFAEYEFFVPLALFPTIPVSENRYSLGFSYKINKHQGFSIRYRLMQPLTKKVPHNNFVLGVKWEIKF